MRGHVEQSSQGRGAPLDVDPVCGSPVPPGDASAFTADHGGHRWRFCSDACRVRFLLLADRARMGEALRTGRFFAPDRRVVWGRA